MKIIIILIHVFGRLPIFELCVKSIWNLMIRYVNKYRFCPVIIISNNDPENRKIRTICEFMGFTYIYKTNRPIGKKLNETIYDLYENTKFDYLMNFGSDDLINHMLFQVYEQHINNDERFFGINNAYIYDISTKKCALFEAMAMDHAIGAGRMIHFDIIDELHIKNQPLYISEYSSGLDSCSASSILFNCNTRENIIDVGDEPYILDIKSSENINTFDNLRIAMPERIKYCDFSDIYRFFGESGEILKEKYYDTNN